MADNIFYFDLGNVLVKFDHAIAVKQLAELTKCSSETAQRVLFDSGLQVRYEMGMVNERQFADQINLEFSTSLGTADILEAISAIFTPNEEILTVLEHVKASGVRIGLLSNTCKAHWQWLCSQPWPMIHGWFDPVVLSFETRCMKPERAIYQQSEILSGCEGPRIFFTDDRADNIAGANAMGWETYHYGNVQGLIQHFDAWRLRIAAL